MFKAKNIPNIITISRLILVIVIVILLSLASPGAQKSFFDYYYITSMGDSSLNKYLIFWLVAGLLFVIAVITDFLDGYLARKYQWITTFGKFMDPLADKIIVNITALALTIFYSNMFPFWILIIFFIRDYILDGIRFVVAKEYNIALSANIFGKLKTSLQMIAMTFIFFIMPLFHNDVIFSQLVLIPLYLSALASIVSCVIYIVEVYFKIQPIEDAKLEKKNDK